MSTQVSEKVCEMVFEVITKIQTKSPHEAVTKNQVFLEIKEKWSYKTIERAFNKLHEEGKIEKQYRGQYWLPEYLERNIEFLTEKIEKNKSEIKFWETVDELRVEKILVLTEKLRELDIAYTELYEDLIERPRILKKLRKKGLI